MNKSLISVLEIEQSVFPPDFPTRDFKDSPLGSFCEVQKGLRSFQADTASAEQTNHTDCHRRFKFPQALCRDRPVVFVSMQKRFCFPAETCVVLTKDLRRTPDCLQKRGVFRISSGII